MKKEKDNCKCSSVYNFFTEIVIGIFFITWIVAGVLCIQRIITTEIVCHTVENTDRELVVLCIEED